ncbi:MarR family winged helix-turn-helix transcriptional regulator [Arthrobacter sp. ok362]|uniref:MarR family winged helix-turn-helix transcriptional regulator n=1 Tax=Arthrobacter sp. ok362 TaxID=1761745 RepID=UPI00088C6D5E|nr:MarR family winged helix-turn-helix transcriptional regulator [Arthrobacter sp. ok362]SDK91475.1 DNA-binding transcriptional regulator, MarR family [Arthrobacter sp. ok362]
MDTSDDHADFYPLFSTLTRLETELWDAVDARLRQECGLPLGRYEAMVVVTSLGTCRVFDIASALSITVGGASKLVDRIEAAGYCSRKLNPGDRRSSLLEPTAAGAAVVEQGRQVVEAELARWFTPALTKQEAGTLHELLARLRSARQPSLDSKAAGQ